MMTSGADTRNQEEQSERGSLLDHALLYARAGWEVLPCRPAEITFGGKPYKAKSPYTPHGFHDATKDEGVIESWWRTWPEALIGVHPAPGLAVLDVDPRASGDTSLRLLLDQHGPLPETAIARTGGGGLHIWLRCDQVRRAQLANGIDVKAHGKGYVIVPPSGHPSGGVYEWAHCCPIARAPGWVRRKLDPPPLERHRTRIRSSNGKDGSGLIRHVAEAQEGERNRKLLWAACRAVEDGIDTELAPALIDAALMAGLSAYEAERVIQNARTLTARLEPGR